MIMSLIATGVTLYGIDAIRIASFVNVQCGLRLKYIVSAASIL